MFILLDKTTNNQDEHRGKEHKRGSKENASSPSNLEFGGSKIMQATKWKVSQLEKQSWYESETKYNQSSR